MRPEVRPPVLIADPGPLLRLAEADRLDDLDRLGRTVVVVDRVADEVYGDLARPFAWKIREWAERLGARFRVERSDTPPGTSTDVALRALLLRLGAPDTGSILVLHEDARAAAICLDAELPMELTTTRRFLASVGGGE